MPLTVQVAANTAIQLVGKFVSAGFAFIITILLARAYGPEGFGEFIKMTTYIGVFYLVADFGINAIYLKEEKSGAVRFGNLLFLRVLWATLLIFCAIALLVFLPFNAITNQGFTPLVKLGIIILAPTILFQALCTSCNVLFQKHLRYDKAVIATIIGTALTLALVYILVTMHASLTVTLTAFVIGALIMAMVSLALSRSYVDGGRLLAELLTNNHVKAWKRLMHQSLPLGLTLIFNLIYFRADIFILSYLRTSADVGIYGLAYKFFDFPLAVPTFFMNAVYPTLIQVNSQQQTVNRIIQKSTIFLLLLSLLLTIGCLLFAPLISLVKVDFAPSVTPFRILAASLPIFFLSSLFMWVLIARGKQWLLLKIYGAGMIVNIVLNLIFIPRFGYYAAAVITGVSEAVVLVFLLRSYVSLRTGAPKISQKL